MTTTSPEVADATALRIATARSNSTSVAMRPWIFGTRIVAGNPDAVGTRLRCPRHQRTLPAITVTTAAENAGDTTGGMALHTGQNFHERVRRVGEIDHDKWMPGRSNELHATGRGR